MVGPPSGEMNCFGAMKLRREWSEAASIASAYGYSEDWFHLLFDRRMGCQGNSNLGVCAMKKTIGLLLLIYGLLLAGLSYLVHLLAPEAARPTLITGLAGGVLCLFWGLRALTGSAGKALPLLTLIPVSFVLLTQPLALWSGGGEGVETRRLAAVVTGLLLALSLGMLVRIAWSGVVFDSSTSGRVKKDIPF